jgi:hypothetical protein
MHNKTAEPRSQKPFSVLDGTFKNPGVHPCSIQDPEVSGHRVEPVPPRWLCVLEL